MTGPRELRPCGTRAAYKRHRRNGEKPCDDCRAAESRAEAKRAKYHRTHYPQKFGPKPPGLDPLVPYRYRARRYPWAVEVLARSEERWGKPEGEAA